MTDTPLLSVDQLASLLDSDATAIVDCRFDLAAPSRGESDYLESHIPGAVYAHLARDLSTSKTGRNGRHPLPSIDAITRTFSSWGIDSSVRVVAYDGEGGAFAARLWWMLRYLGVTSAQVLNGGFAAWKEASLPVRSGREVRAPRRFEAHPHPEMRIDLDELTKARGEHLLIDARDPARYRGDQEPLDPVAGHIPGARNHFWQMNLDERGRFHSPEHLRQLYLSLLDDTPAERAVVYCGSGVTACHDLIAMELAGIHGAKLYPGSWSEWCSDPERPVETSGQKD